MLGQKVIIKLKKTLILIISLLPGLASATVNTFPQPTLVIPTAPALTAKSHMLIDFDSDHVITEQNADLRVEPASITKMMTIYVVNQAIKNGKVKPADMVMVSEKAWRMEGSRMFIDLNSLVSVEDLMRGIIIQSGNDASVAIAEHVAGNEDSFAEMMNFYAKQLVMSNTHYVNATGLPDPNQYTTAKDIAKLAKAVIRDFPETYKIYAQKEFTYKDIKQENRNRLLWRNELVDGGKTGHTDSAGYCLVASGKKDNMRLISVVMGTSSDNTRIDESNKLLTYGFRFFETRKIYPGNTLLKKSRIWMGTINEVELGLPDDLYVTIGHGQYDKLQTSINVQKVLKAPASVGTALGTISVQLNNKVVIQKPIVALNNIETAGFFKRMYDSIALKFHGILGDFSN